MNNSKSSNFNPFKQSTPNAQEWGKVKFVPKVPKSFVKPNRIVENAATPWKNFKDEILAKQREEQSVNSLNMKSEDAQDILKKREQNYRRMLITEKAKEPTKWESFDNDTEVEGKSKAKNSNRSILKGIDVKNFDPKKLNFKQQNQLRKIITKGIFAAKNTDLEKEVLNIKRQNEIKKLKKVNKKNNSNKKGNQFRNK